MTNNPNQHQKVADELERRLKAPTRDGAEGAAKYLDDIESGMLSRDAPTPSQIAETLRSAPPKPAPDAVRAAVQSVIDEMIVVATQEDDGNIPEWTSENQAEIDKWQVRLADAIAAPVPSPDGARCLNWAGECNHFKTTGEPCETCAPSPAVAAEPGLGEIVHDKMRDMLANAQPNHPALVRGDREDLIRRLRSGPASTRDLTAWRALAEEAVDVLSLSVQSAPDWEQLREAIASAYALTQWQEKLENLEGSMQDGCRDFANRVVEAMGK